MKDPIVEEIRKYRMEHTQRFGGDLHRICEDLREEEKKYPDRLVHLEPRKLSSRKPLCVAEEPAEYKTKTGE
ncbi:MAG: hypothetical protein MUC65_10905 [Pontiellaceae bacterium]|jgi:hypothetical protein|nr:hypothetical protein [Pontiellaceae bacterium]